MGNSVGVGVGGGVGVGRSGAVTVTWVGRVTAVVDVAVGGGSGAVMVGTETGAGVELGTVERLVLPPECLFGTGCGRVAGARLTAVGSGG